MTPPDPRQQLEDAFAAAIERGDIDEINSAADALETYERTAPPKPQATLAQAALWYASVGLRVFPLSPGTKIPFKGSNGCRDASTHADIVGGWWDRHPEANIGIATGRLIDVVDVDGQVGQQSRAALWATLFGEIDAANVGKVLTPSPGGMHIWVPATGDGNTTNMAPSVDYRGEGGYVVAPPSRLPNGSYRFLGQPDLHVLAELRGAAA